MGRHWASLVLVSILAGCVTTGDVSPLETEKGRNEARDAYIRLGLGYLQRGLTAQAKERLGRALDIDPDSAEAHAALALVFQHEMEVALADEQFRLALAEGANARIQNNYGSFLYEQRRYAEAFAQFEAASADTLYAGRGRVFESMGLTSLKLEQPEQARQYFVRALRLDAQRASALLELAELEFEARNYVPARRYYDRHQDVVSEPTARSLLLGVRLAQVFKEADQEAALAQQLRRLYPGSPESQSLLMEQ